MRVKAYRTTMPFDNRDTGEGPALSPLTNKSKALEIDPDYGRRLELGKYETDHRMISDEDSGEKSWVINPIFNGELKWDRTGLNSETEKDYVAYLSNGTMIPFRNKTYNQVINILNKQKMKWRVISPDVSRSMKSAQKKPFISFVSEILASCFKIESESYKNKVKEVGSGFYIRDNYLLTCAHVITKSEENPKDLGIFIIDGNKKLPARVVDIDHDLDCALLYCDATQHSFLEVKEINSIDVGQEVVCVGSPYGYDNNVTKGILSSKDRKVGGDDIPYFFMDLSVYPGSSGGPVVDASDGKVFGMAAVIIESVGNYGLNAGVPIEICLKRFSKVLKEIKNEDL